MNEFYVPRKRIKSFQSTDSLDKWRESDAIDDVEKLELSGTLRCTRGQYRTLLFRGASSTTTSGQGKHSKC